jgi:hypothetical protein
MGKDVRLRKPGNLVKKYGLNLKNRPIAGVLKGELDAILKTNQYFLK